jgi:protein TonB
VVQIPAEFPGGLPAWTNYLRSHLNSGLPVENGAPPGKYTVYVTFIVDKNGVISDVAAENDPGYGTKDEAIRVIKRGPNWKPAVQNGRNVIYRHKQGITFVVQDE